MTYREALEIRPSYVNLIGKVVTSGNSSCNVEDIIIAPPDLIIHYLEEYRKRYDYEIAISRFINRTDLEIMVFGLNPRTGGEILLKINDLDN